MHRIEVIGDSHILNFFEKENTEWTGTSWQIDDFHIEEHFGASLAGTTIWGLQNENSSTGSGKRIKNLLETHDIENFAMVLGEVDLRFHVHKNLNGRSIEEGVQEVIDAYEKWISEVVVPNITGKVIAFGGSPYGKNAHDVNQTIRDCVPVFEKKLKEMTERNGWHCIESYETMVDEHGNTSERYYGRDPIHKNPYNTFHDIVLPALKKIFQG